MVKKKFLLRSPEHPFKRKAQNSQFYKVTCTFFVNKGGKKKQLEYRLKKEIEPFKWEKKKMINFMHPGGLQAKNPGFRLEKSLLIYHGNDFNLKIYLITSIPIKCQCHGSFR